VVIPAIDGMKGLTPARRGLMLSYHNVAKLRQFHGAHPANVINSPLAHSQGNGAQVA